MSVRRQTEPVIRGLRTGASWLVSYLWLVAPVTAVGWHIVEAARHVAGQLSLTEDAALFYYSGRQWVQAGRVPYRHLWDIKPPLIHETAAVLALITGGDPVATYYIGNALNVSALLGGVTAGAVAVRELTDSRLAGAATGFACLALPKLFSRIVTGLRPKYVVVLLLGLVLLAGVRKRWVATGALAAAAAGFWQPGLAVLLVVLGTLWWLVKRGELAAQVGDRAALAAFGVAAVAVLPVVLGGALPEMLVQTVFAPLVTTDSGVPLRSVFSAIHPTLLSVAAIGAVGVGWRADHSVRWWPALFLLAFAGVILSGDFDGSADLIPLSYVVAVGVGAAVGAARPPDVRPLLSDPRLWLLALLGVAIWLTRDPIVPVRDAGHLRGLFFSGGVEPRCHLRMSGPEQQVMRLFETTEAAQTCWRPDWWP